MVDGSSTGEGTTGSPPDLDADYRVSDEVVASVAGMAAAEVAGVTAMGAGPGLGDVLAKRYPTRGVRVEIGTREVAVDVYLHVAYGERIPAVAQRVQESVRRAVEGMTGLRVVEVNVHVQGLSIPGGRPGLDPGGGGSRRGRPRPGMGGVGGASLPPPAPRVGAVGPSGTDGPDDGPDAGSESPRDGSPEPLGTG